MTESVVQGILEVLDQAAAEFGRSGLIAAVDVPLDAGFRCYRYQHRGLAGALRELIVLPVRPELSGDAAVGRLRSLTPSDVSESRVVFIDAFSCTSAADGDRSWTTMRPLDLWRRVVGAQAHGVPESEARLIDAEFVARSFFAVSDCDAPPEADSNALDYLRDWARQPPERERNLLVFDERGAGKSWLLKRFAIEQAKVHEIKPWVARPALYVNLANYRDRLLREQGIEKSLAYLLLERTTALVSGASQPLVGDVLLLDAVIRSGRAVLLLDSLDELARDLVGDEMEWHFQRLLDFLPAQCKSVVAVRGTRFRSMSLLQRAFVPRDGAPFPIEPTHGRAFGLARHLREANVQRYAQRHRLLRLGGFSTADVALLAQRLGISDGPADVQAPGVSSMVSACAELSKIPACAANLLHLQSEAGLSPFARFELVVLYELIDYNIRTERALLRLRYRDGVSTREEHIDLPLRLRILEHIAWHLLETGRESFDPILVADTFLEAAATRFEAVIRDISAQTVFELSPDGVGLRFRVEAIHAFFLARYLYSSLVSGGRGGCGGPMLGRHNLTTTSLGRATLAFLQALVDERSEFPPSECPSDAHPSRAEIGAAVTKAAAARPFSSWTRYLHVNVRELDLGHVDRPSLEWMREDLPDDLRYDDGLDVIVGDRLESGGFFAFRIERREITNSEFEEFLASDWVPRLVATESNLGWRSERVEFAHVPTRRARQERVESHPLSWLNTHPRRGGLHRERGFRAFTNDFHLYQWRATQMPSEMGDEPLVWASFYVAALYCNWRTGKRFGFDSCESAYELFIDEGRYPRLALLDRLGYRLPKADEWRYASTAGEDPAAYAWETLPTDQQETYRDCLTRPQQEPRSVMSSAPNAFGLYGMIGNVREWCHESTEQEKKDAQDVQFGRILGANWALEESFRYDSPGMSLPMFNTNIDVGFRVAQSLGTGARAAIATAWLAKAGR